MLVEALVTKPAVERLDEGVIGRLAGPGDLALDVIAVRPGVQGLGDELRALVDREPLRPLAARQEAFRATCTLLAGRGSSLRTRPGMLV